ncbi:NlpC/P60 family protein [Janibacter limosus]|uniref:Cell wall lytic activity n=1 Tax=Janibacter limosus TaxID=53458 RepID=A0A4P6MVA1_9MICO|nr:NlpC/P60 family protein [Janibacter limosus]QBF47694.1 cell wall lytic activity [Janibacter limosus]
MSTFHTARHSARRTHRTAAHRAGAGVLAATALGLGASMMTATGAAAQGGPEAPASSTSTASAPSAGTATSSSSFDDVVRVGDRGIVVEQIQDKVGVTSDGVFGSETEQGVISWQNDHGLSADGIVGSETGSRMGLSSGSTTSTASSSETAAASTSSPASDSSIVETARGLVGTPYVMGGTSTSGFDCSGFVQHVYEAAGKDVPRTTQDQQAAATPVSDPQPGDIVFFGNPAYHNGIYAGDGKIIDAGNPSTGVSERDIWTDDVTYGRF